MILLPKLASFILCCQRNYLDSWLMYDFPGHYAHRSFTGFSYSRCSVIHGVQLYSPSQPPLLAEKGRGRILTMFCTLALFYKKEIRNTIDQGIEKRYIVLARRLMCPGESSNKAYLTSMHVDLYLDTEKGYRECYTYPAFIAPSADRRRKLNAALNS